MEIVFDEILDGTNFEKRTSMFDSHDTPYDVQSVMHYGPYQSSKSGKKTIIPLMDNVTIE